MKATLEFNLTEEHEEYRLHRRGSEFHSALWEVSDHLRSACKYGDYKNQETFEALEHARDLLYASLDGEL